MYGLKVVRHGACYKHTHLTVLCRIGLMDKIVHYSKMSKTLEKPRKSFPERWEPSQKRAGSVSLTCGGNDVRRSVRFSVRPWSGILPPHFGLLRFTADAYNRPNFGQLPCGLSVGFRVEMCRLHFLRRVDKNRSERRVGGHRDIYRTRPDAEHIPLRPIFTRFPARKHPDIYEFGKN